MIRILKNDQERVQNHGHIIGDSSLANIPSAPCIVIILNLFFEEKKRSILIFAYPDFSSTLSNKPHKTIILILNPSVFKHGFCPNLMLCLQPTSPITSDRNILAIFFSILSLPLFLLLCF